MSPEQLVALAILAVAILLFVTERLRVDVVALGVVVALLLTGLLSVGEALAGFSNPAVLTIAALFVVGGAVMQTGLAGAIGRRVLRISGGGEVRIMLAVTVTVALLSSVMSDTGTVAVMLPAVVSMAAAGGVAPSRLLMPLAYGSLLGGATTLIGTPPNLIASDLLRESGYGPLGFFSFLPIGGALLVVGLLYLLTVGRRLLPVQIPRTEAQRDASPEELLEIYRLPDNLFRLRVRRASPLVGRSIGDADLRRRHGVTVLEVHRAREPRMLGRVGVLPGASPASALEEIPANADTVLQLDDALIVRGAPPDVWHAAADWNLAVQAASPMEGKALVDQEAGIAEVLLPPRSDLAGKTLAEARFGRTLGLTVLGINRPGAVEPPDLDVDPLQFGDILLVQGRWSDILALRDRRKDFVVMGQPEAMVGAPARARAPVAAIVLLSMVALIAFGLLPVATASLLAALAMVLTGCVTMDQAYEAIDWRSVVLVAGMIPMSTALEKVGLIDVFAGGLITGLGDLGPTAVIAGLFLATSICTQVLSNTATTVLIAPIGLAAARELGIVQPQAFVVSVAIAASMALASPVASPVNTLVMGAGRYRFSDYARVGTPLILVALIVTVLLAPIVFPFAPAP